MLAPSVNLLSRTARSRAVSIRFFSIAGGLIALAILAAPGVQKADCGNTAGRRSAAVAKVVEALRAYERCIGSPDNKGDCADEMQALDDAHDDFADVVADAKACP